MMLLRRIVSLIKWKEFILDFKENMIVAVVGNKNDLKEKRIVL